MTNRQWLKLLREQRDPTTWAAYADWLQDNGGSPLDVARAKEKALLGTIHYYVREKGTQDMGMMFTTLSAARGHANYYNMDEGKAEIVARYIPAAEFVCILPLRKHQP